MSSQAIQRIIDETVFSMETEGFEVPEDEIKILHSVLSGDTTFDNQLYRYIESARRAGGLINAS